MIPEKENSIIEFKKAFNEAVIETIVAFSNSKGGTLFIGVTDHREIVGVTIGKESLVHWVNEIKSKTVPQIIPDIETIRHNGKTIVKVIINEYPIKPVCTRGRYFKRVENANHLLSVSEVVDLHLQSLNSSWDAYPDPVHAIDDISIDKVQEAIETMMRNHMTIVENPLSFLAKYNLLRENKLTNAAYLLFKKKESVDTAIELGRFQTEIIIKDSRRSKSDVIAQIDEVLEFVKKHINKEVIITAKPHNIQRWQYPIEALREIITNMVVHRDYRLSSDSIVKIFDHKIEFYNPGRLPDSITIQDLLNNNYRSTPRNKLLADFFKDLGLIEKYGSGIQRIINYFREEQLPSPEFQNISDGFMVTVFAKERKEFVKNAPENVPENAPEKRITVIMEFIKLDAGISMLDLAKKIGVDHKTIKRDIAKLKSLGLLRRIGPAKGGHWEVPDK